MATNASHLGDVEKLKVADLRKELRNRGLSSGGNKSELVERLQLAIHTDSMSTGIEAELNEDEMLGDVEDEILSEDPKTNSTIFTEEDILSPTLEKKSPTLLLEKENVLKSLPPANPVACTEKPQVKETSPFVKISPKVVKTMSAQDKLALRAMRFNTQSGEDSKKLQRVLRFGGQAKGGGVVQGSNVEKLQQRADRFGVNVAQSLKKLEEKERLQRRKERFGAVVSSNGKGLDVEEKKKKRAERFGLN